LLSSSLSKPAARRRPEAMRSSLKAIREPCRPAAIAFALTHRSTSPWDAIAIIVIHRRRINRKGGSPAKHVVSKLIRRSSNHDNKEAYAVSSYLCLFGFDSDTSYLGTSHGSGAEESWGHGSGAGGQGEISVHLAARAGRLGSNTSGRADLAGDRRRHLRT